MMLAHFSLFILRLKSLLVTAYLQAFGDETIHQADGRKIDPRGD